MVADDKSLFLQAIAHAPGDDLVRLVYADWLEERGDEASAARGRLIRLQCELAKVAPCQADIYGCGQEGFPVCDDCRHRADLEAATAELSDEWERVWFPSLSAGRLGYDRGFVRSFTGRISTWLIHAGEAHHELPLRELVLTEGDLAFGGEGEVVPPGWKAEYVICRGQPDPDPDGWFALGSPAWTFLPHHDPSLTVETITLVGITPASVRGYGFWMHIHPVKVIFQTDVST